LRGDVHDRGDSDAARVVGEAGEVRLLEPLVAEHRVHAALIEVEGPRALVMGGARHAHGEHVLQTQQAPGDEGAVRPGAGAGGDETVATGLDGPAVATIAGDAVVDVVHVPVEGLAGGDVAAAGRVLCVAGGA